MTARPYSAAKRLFDVAFSLGAIVTLSPVLALAALGVRLSSPGPIFYRASRMGRGSKPFRMYKFRSMDSRCPSFTSPITATRDPRIFPFGAFLRRTKIDELPQLFNILNGDMSLVGPRPEDADIVRNYYAPPHMETLDVLPGLSSPGTLHGYTRADDVLAGGDPEKDYVDRLLPMKLALDTVYVRRASFVYDLAIIARTAGVIAAMLLGRRTFPPPPEMEQAKPLIHPCRQRPEPETPS